MGVVYRVLALGRHAASDTALKTLTNRFPNGSAYSIAQLHAFRGNKNLAFEWLNKACVERQGGCELLKSDRVLRNLHDDPRYRALLVKMKLNGNQLSEGRGVAVAASGGVSSFAVAALGFAGSPIGEVRRGVGRHLDLCLRARGDVRKKLNHPDTGSGASAIDCW